jgi:hypothetical protein
VRRMTARPANAHQARLLRLLRDGGPNSRAQLGDQVDLSRSKLAVEVDRLLETGPGGGRRTRRLARRPPLPQHPARSRPALPRRRHRRHLGRCGRHQRGAGGAGPHQPAHGRPRGPGRGLRASPGHGRQVEGLRARGGVRRRRHRRAGPGPLPRGRPGRPADHAGLGRVPRTGGAQPGTGLPRHGRQRREPDGHGGAARGRRPLRGRLPLRQDRHRHRLRHRRRR